MIFLVQLAPTTLALLLFACFAFGQTSIKDDSKDHQKAIEQKALALLGETLADAASLKLAENRALISASAADLLWTHDEKRARAAFQDALGNLAQVKIKSDRRRGGHGEWMRLQVRQQVLQLLARRDPQMVLDYLRQARGQAVAEEKTADFPPEMELQLEQSLAAQVAARDPKLSVQMAEESLAKGVSHGLVGVVAQLQRQDAASAAKLTGVIIS